MRKSKPPPVQAPMIDQNWALNHHWLRWFQDVANYIDNYRRSPDLVYTTSTSLTTDDYGKSIVFNNGSSNITCNLPTATSKDVYCWIGPIYRLGTGKVTITADSASTIEYSSAGGSIFCNEERRAAANVTLQLIAANKWAIIGGTGLWKTD